ncbi:uncharacterized protein LOC123305114 [Chrysoperla carnea]|uniref:uncharacterized protein LOC123305114 n=1 Tax=Chrysoperla carnea TaxID=189513 RepID=UPI001D06249B|nr:uncharacterized protein LOC123305114 [Chrysoperla carnea]
MDSVILDTRNLLLSPSNRAKMRAKTAAMKIKHGSPKLKEVLRNRCKIRMKEQRSKSFDQARKTAPFESILLQELEDFDFDKEYDIYMNCKSNDFNEASQSGEDDWIMNEIDRIISVDEAALEQMLEHKVICPICQKGELELITNEIAVCMACNESLPAPNGLEDFESCINKAIQLHNNAQCMSIPGFVKLPDCISNLYLVCEDCSCLNKNKA